MKEIIIDANAANQRFDRFCRKYFKQYPEVTLAEIYRWIRKGDIRIHNKKTSEKYILQVGDNVMLKTFVTKQLVPISREEKVTHLSLKQITKHIIYEDDHRVVFDKPAGIPMHGGTKNTETLCMNNYLEKYVDIQGFFGGQKNTIEGFINDTCHSHEGGNPLHENRFLPPQEGQKKDRSSSILSDQNNWFKGQDHPSFKPSFCYRLDKDTSGVLVAAKEYQSLQYLNQLIRERQTEKSYLTIVAGVTPEYKHINLPLEKSYDKKFGRGITQVSKQGKPAETEFTTLCTIAHPILGNISLLQVKIYTGRMHQIRVHLAHIGHPVLGDIIYGNPVLNRKLYKDLKINRQILHCKQYSFVDRDRKVCNFTTSIPQDIDKIMQN